MGTAGKGTASAVCLASLISASTTCSASPGHTAQPFQPTETAIWYIGDAWSRDVLHVCAEILPTICGKKASVKRSAHVSDANKFAETQLRAGDLVFVDPPYSAAQYSRFYHVLETISKGECGEVSGVDGTLQPRSARSRCTARRVRTTQFEALLTSLGEAGCSAIMTFPQDGVQQRSKRRGTRRAGSNMV